MPQASGLRLWTVMTGGEKYLESFSEYLDADLIIGGYMRVKNNEMVNDNYWDFLPEGLYYSCEKFLGDNRHTCKVPFISYPKI